jgi:hypothetical protein
MVKTLPKLNVLYTACTFIERNVAILRFEVYNLLK